ncbi:MAG: hypothetical protein ACFFD2_00615 [Promethearchaeota archaeon]
MKKKYYKKGKIIAYNQSGYPITLEIKLNSSLKIFFLLNLVYEIRDWQGFFREILDIIKKRYLKGNIYQIEFAEKPSWIDNYQGGYESKLKIKLKDLNHFKRILYSYGKGLSYNVFELLEKLGFKAKWIEKEGKYDIEIDLDGIIGIVKVKGLKKFANNQHLRQLLDYYELERIVKIVKGIFIVNHFREDEPKKRGDPFTKDTIKLAERNEFCLINTVELFRQFNQFLENGINLQTLKKRILKTNAQINFL